MVQDVQFFLGLGSRYSYLASTQIAALEIETGCCVQWLPIKSYELMQRRGQNPFVTRNVAGDCAGALVSGQYSDHYRQVDIRRWADFYGVPYQDPVEPIMDAQRRTLYCVAAEILGRAASFCRAMFEALYIQGLAIREDDCLKMAADSGVDADRLRDLVNSGDAEKRHGEIIASALALNVFGVPSFAVNGEVYWGNDRIVLLREKLKSLD